MTGKPLIGCADHQIWDTYFQTIPKWCIRHVHTTFLCALCRNLFPVTQARVRVLRIWRIVPLLPTGVPMRNSQIGKAGFGVEGELYHWPPVGICTGDHKIAPGFMSLFSHELVIALGTHLCLPVRSLALKKRKRGRILLSILPLFLFFCS